MKVDSISDLWPLVLPAILWLVRWQYMAIANVYTHLVFRLVSFCLPQDSKLDWQCETLYTLLALIFEDAKREKPEKVLLNAVVRATSLVPAAFEERAHYRQRAIAAELVGQRAESPLSAADMYCVKCRARRCDPYAQLLTMRNGKRALKGTCANCGTKMFKIGVIASNV